MHVSHMLPSPSIYGIYKTSSVKRTTIKAVSRSKNEYIFFHVHIGMGGKG